ncbi:MAG: hypothetical protein PHE59_04900 [Patescibacteria group bacterium]|nr:hypothetical protein [Patescibacteria group bacterium]
MRHCIIALVWDSKDTTERDMVEKGEDFLRKGVVLRKCGICGSEEIARETVATKYSTMEEAKPQLEILERANAVARDIFQQRRN